MKLLCFFFTILILYVFFYSRQARSKVTEMINNAIVHYRDDMDLQNLIDFGQMEVSVQSMYVQVPPRGLFMARV